VLIGEITPASTMCGRRLAGVGGQWYQFRLAAAAGCRVRFVEFHGVGNQLRESGEGSELSVACFM
jgi:hypothetical protein